MKILVKVKGGPGSGNRNHAGIPGHQGGSAPASWPKTSVDWRKLTNDNAPPLTDRMYRWANLQEIQDLFLNRRTRSLDVSEDPEFYFAPAKKLIEDNFLTRTYGRFILDSAKLAESGWKRDSGLFGEMAWRSMVSDVDTVKAYKDAIIGFELQDNPKQFPIEDMQDWLNFRIGR